MRMTVLLALLLCGCAAENATLVNDNGQKRYCYKSATGAFSNIAAMSQFNKCLNDAGTAGFHRIE